MARPPKYQFDKSFFDDIDNDEKAYWLGFVAADGCVTERSLIVTLSSRDLGHLGALKAALKADYPIKTKPNPQGGESATLCVNSTEFVAKLGHHNIVPRKTFIFAMPRMRADLVGSFVRGVFDGDGCVHRGISRSGNPFYVVQIAGTLMLMEQIQQHWHYQRN